MNVYFPPITKTAKYFDNQYFNSVKCLADKCISCVYNLVQIVNENVNELPIYPIY